MHCLLIFYKKVLENCSIFRHISVVATTTIWGKVTDSSKLETTLLRIHNTNCAKRQRCLQQYVSCWYASCQDERVRKVWVVGKTYTISLQSSR